MRMLLCRIARDSFELKYAYAAAGSEFNLTIAFNFRVTHVSALGMQSRIDWHPIVMVNRIYRI
jgi:hypothetical protein